MTGRPWERPGAAEPDDSTSGVAGGVAAGRDARITGLMNVIGALTPQLVKAAGERGVADLISTSSVRGAGHLPELRRLR